MAERNAFIKPPQVLIDPMIFLFYAAGTWGIILTGLRIVVDRNMRRALSDLFGCAFAFFCATLLTNYAANALTTRAAGSYFIVAIGLLVIANAVVSFAFRGSKYQ
jgi:uncharacterized membrane protein